MKKGIHPESYRPVIFEDINNGFKILIKSTIHLGNNPEETVWENGKKYPIAKVQISSASHNFYTNKKVAVDEMGTIAKFKAKYNKSK